MEQTFHQFLKEKCPLGRPLIIATPAEFEKRINEYFEWCDNTPYEDEDFVGKDATTVIRKRRRAYILQEIAIWLGLAGIDSLYSYKEREDFFSIYMYMLTKVQGQQLAGAVNNHFNANIVARLVGLAENVNHNAAVSHSITPESTTELANILRNAAIKAADDM